MGKKPAARQASPMWVNTEDLPTSSGHPFFPCAMEAQLRRLQWGCATECVNDFETQSLCI